MALRSMQGYIEQLNREESIKEAGFEQVFLTSCAKGSGLVRVCRECGELPKAYTRDGKFVLACSRCGKVFTDEAPRGLDAVTEWNKLNNKAKGMSVTRNGFTDQETKKTFCEVYAEDGGIRIK